MKKIYLSDDDLIILANLSISLSENQDKLRNIQSDIDGLNLYDSLEEGISLIQEKIKDLVN